MVKDTAMKTLTTVPDIVFYFSITPNQYKHSLITKENSALIDLCISCNFYKEVSIIDDSL